MLISYFKKKNQLTLSYSTLVEKNELHSILAK